MIIRYMSVHMYITWYYTELEKHDNRINFSIHCIMWYTDVAYNMIIRSISVYRCNMVWLRKHDLSDKFQYITWYTDVAHNRIIR